MKVVCVNNMVNKSIIDSQHCIVFKKCTLYKSLLKKVELFRWVLLSILKRNKILNGTRDVDHFRYMTILGGSEQIWRVLSQLLSCEGNISHIIVNAKWNKLLTIRLVSNNTGQVNPWVSIQRLWCLLLYKPGKLHRGKLYWIQYE